MTKVKRIDNDKLFAEVENVIEGGGRVQLRVKGNSMRPFLVDGRDTVNLAPIGRSSLLPGMVVLFRHRNHHILHRIRRIDGDKLILKGDGNYRIAEISTRGSVAAFAESIVRKGHIVRYGSFGWKWISMFSLLTKLTRTVYYDLRRVAKRLLISKKASVKG